MAFVGFVDSFAGEDVDDVLDTGLMLSRVKTLVMLMVVVVSRTNQKDDLDRCY